MYIIDQRLNAQDIPKDRADKGKQNNDYYSFLNLDHKRGGTRNITNLFISRMQKLEWRSANRFLIQTHAKRSINKGNFFSS